MRSAFVVVLCILPLAWAGGAAAHVAPTACPANAVVTSVGDVLYIWRIAPLTWGIPSLVSFVANSWWYLESGAEPGLQAGNPDGHVVFGEGAVVPGGHPHACQALANWDYIIY